MSTGKLTNLPHALPLEQSTFVSSHDSFYQRPGLNSARPPRNPEKVPLTGHLNNGQKPVRNLPFGRNVSTAHATFGKGGDAPVFGKGKGPTAHVRNQGHIGAGGPNEPMISTAKAAYQVPGQPPQGRDFRYAGDAGMKYNPDLLRIDEPPSREKPKQEWPPPPSRATAVRSGVHTIPGAKLDVPEKIPFRLPDRLKGNPNMLNKSLESTAAGKMGGNISRVGCFDEVFQGTTTYRHFMVNQWKLPEPADSIRKGKQKSEDLVRLNHVEVDYSAAKALNSTRGFDGKLVPEKPAGVHPTIWRLEQEKERSKI